MHKTLPTSKHYLYSCTIDDCIADKTQKPDKGISRVLRVTYIVCQHEVERKCFFGFTIVSRASAELMTPFVLPNLIDKTGSRRFLCCGIGAGNRTLTSRVRSHKRLLKKSIQIPIYKIVVPYHKNAHGMLQMESVRKRGKIGFTWYDYKCRPRERSRDLIFRRQKADRYQNKLFFYWSS